MMKKIILPILLLAACSGLKSDLLAQASISFDTLSYNYGTIKKNAPGGTSFSFTNKGNEPLIITKVVSSCGCTVPSYPKTPVMPGQTDIIKVLYNTKTPGEFSKTINIHSNDPKKSMVVLTIKGVVVK
jgi:hypothetical protein